MTYFHKKCEDWFDNKEHNDLTATWSEDNGADFQGCMEVSIKKSTNGDHIDIGCLKVY